MLRLGIVVLTAGLALGQTVLTRVSERPEILRLDFSHRVAPLWNGSVLIGAEKNYSSAPIIWTLDVSGNKEEIHFSMPGAAIVEIAGLAGAADGAIVAAGFAAGNDGSSWGFVGTIPPNRGRNTIVRDDAYHPEMVMIAPDGVVWTVGSQKGDDQKRIYNVLKRYSGSGKLLTSQVVQTGGYPGWPGLLRSSRDRVGWLTADANYMEFALDGHETNRFPGPPRTTKTLEFRTLALGDDFGVIAQSGNSGKIWTLDRVKSVWNPVAIAGEPLGVWPIVYGFDGDQLVLGTSTKDRGFLIVHLSVESR